MLFYQGLQSTYLFIQYTQILTNEMVNWLHRNELQVITNLGTLENSKILYCKIICRHLKVKSSYPQPCRTISWYIQVAPQISSHCTYTAQKITTTPSVDENLQKNLFCEFHMYRGIYTWKNRTSSIFEVFYKISTVNNPQHLKIVIIENLSCKWTGSQN